MEPHRLAAASAHPALERPLRSLVRWSAGGGIDHMRALYVQTPATLVGYLLAVGVVAAVYAPLAEAWRLWGWLGAVMALWVLRLLHYLRYLREPAADEARLLAWRRSWRVLVVLQGSMWGIAVWLFWGLGTPYDKIALILVVYGICVSSVQLLATQAWVFLSFISLVLTPTIVRIASDGSQSGHLALAVIVAMLFMATVLMARTHLTALGQAITLKERTDQLAAQLRTEVAATEEARRVADEARRAQVARLDGIQEVLKRSGADPEVAAAAERVRRVAGALVWELTQAFPDRLWELKKALRTIDQQLKAAREEQLAQQQQANRELVRNLAHEIKNPLGGIRGAAQLLAMEVNSKELTEYTRVIIHEADRLQALVDRLLAPHRRPQVVADVNIHEVCERVRSLILAEFPRGLAVARDYDISIPEFRGDREQLIQAVLNIVHNATQALGERIAAGDARILLRTRVVRQATFGRQRFRLALELHIEDNGPGVSEAVRDRIFHPLVSGREGGSGLGLTLAQTFVQQHHGTIDCESVPGRTVFKILIPLP